MAIGKSHVWFKEKSYFNLGAIRFSSLDMWCIDFSRDLIYCMYFACVLTFTWSFACLTINKHCLMSAFYRYRINKPMRGIVNLKALVVFFAFFDLPFGIWEGIHLQVFALEFQIVYVNLMEKCGNCWYLQKQDRSKKSCFNLTSGMATL